MIYPFDSVAATRIMTYKGHTIERIFLSGYYVSGIYKADTIQGIKKLINHNLKK